MHIKHKVLFVFLFLLILVGSYTIVLFYNLQKEAKLTNKPIPNTPQAVADALIQDAQQKVNALGQGVGDVLNQDKQTVDNVNNIGL